MNNQLAAYAQIKNDDEVVNIKDMEKFGGGYSSPFSVGFPAIDTALLGGVREGDLVIITGLSGHGKTLLSQTISVNLSKQMFSSLWFSYEIPLHNLAARFKSMGAPDESFLIFTPRRNTSGNLKWVKEKIKEGMEKYNTKFIFVDHLEFLSPTTIHNSDQLRMILNSVCMELKTLAIELGVIIFLMAHVKKVESREVQMQDISESSGVYKLADFVISITRCSEIKMLTSGQKEEAFTNRSIIKILKNRLTGELPKLNVIFENNILCPL
jgi:predicted ATP-dependent serine protease